MSRRRDLGQPVDDVEVDAGLPLRDHRLFVVLDEAHLGQPGLDPRPSLLVSEQLGGVELGGIMHDREGLLESFASTPQLDLRPHVVTEPAPATVGCGAGRDRAAEQVGAVEAQLQRDERSHRLPEDRDGRLADRLDQPAGVAGHVGDRPRQRFGTDGLADAAVVVGRVAEVLFEERDVPPMPVPATPAAACDPDDVASRPTLVVADRHAVELELWHRLRPAS